MQAMVHPQRNGKDSLEVSAANFSNYRDYPRFDSDSTDDARAPATSDRIRSERIIVYQGPTNEYDNGAPEFNGSNISDFIARWNRHARRHIFFREENKNEMLWYCGETQRDMIEELPEFMTLKELFKAGDRKQQQMIMGFLRALTSDGTPTGFRSYLMTFHRISNNLLRTGVISSNMERAKFFLRGLHQKAFDKITRLHEVFQDDHSTFDYNVLYQ
ncbi:hypothetical protein K3495_g12060 [Podosphaera aphanis]|nr:hypothetical protein K3495_g12060 [Podosphaera aphanis]